MDDVFELNIVIHADGKLATLIYDEIVKRVLKDDQKLIVSADDFAFDTMIGQAKKKLLENLFQLVMIS